MHVSQKCWCQFGWNVQIYCVHSSAEVFSANTHRGDWGLQLQLRLSVQTWDWNKSCQLTLGRKSERREYFPKALDYQQRGKESLLDRTHTKKRIFRPSSHHAERKPILTLFTTNSTFHSFYSLSWQLLPTRGNSLESNCQESTALAFREGERKG